MRPLVICCAAAAAFVAGIGAWWGLAPRAAAPRPDVEVTAPPSSGPHLEIRENPIAFGMKFDDEAADVSVTLRNTGDAPLHVNRIDANCGCIGVGPTPSDIAPGKDAELKLRLRFTGMSGQISRRVSFDTNEPTHSVSHVRLEGEITPRLGVEPRLVALRPASLDETTAVDLDVTSNDGRALTGLTASSATRGLTLSTTTSEKSARVHVVAAPFDDDFQGSVVLRLGNYERVVSVAGTAARDVRVVPDRLETGALRPGEPLVAKIVSRRGVAWRVRAVESDRKDLKGVVDGDSLRITIDASAPRGAFTGEVILVFEGAKPERVHVSVTAFVRD